MAAAARLITNAGSTMESTAMGSTRSLSLAKKSIAKPRQTILPDKQSEHAEAPAERWRPDATGRAGACWVRHRAVLVPDHRGGADGGGFRGLRLRERPLPDESHRRYHADTT
jgi:hypothetical protein